MLIRGLEVLYYLVAEFLVVVHPLNDEQSLVEVFLLLSHREDLPSLFSWHCLNALPYLFYLLWQLSSGWVKGTQVVRLLCGSVLCIVREEALAVKEASLMQSVEAAA